MTSVALKSSLLIVVMALAACLVAGDACTPATCPPSGVSVLQNFETPDCSGSNYTLSPHVNYSTSCVEASWTSYHNLSAGYSCSADVLVGKYFDGASRLCRASEYSYSVSESIGKCLRNNDNTSSVIWCTPADATSKTPKAPQAVDLSAAVMPYKYSCNETTGCGDDRCTARIFRAAGCPNDKISLVTDPVNLVFSVQSYADTKIGTCYYTNATRSTGSLNLKSSVSNGVFTMTSSYGGCGSSSSMINAYSYPTDTCIAMSTGTWLKVTCSTSSAAQIGSGAFLLLLALLAFIAIL